MSYQAEYQNSIDNPEALLRQKAELIEWYRFPETILSRDEEG